MTNTTINLGADIELEVTPTLDVLCSVSGYNFGSIAGDEVKPYGKPGHIFVRSETSRLTKMLLNSSYLLRESEAINNIIEFASEYGVIHFDEFPAEKISQIIKDSGLSAKARFSEPEDIRVWYCRDDDTALLEEVKARFKSLAA